MLKKLPDHFNKTSYKIHLCHKLHIGVLPHNKNDYSIIPYLKSISIYFSRHLSHSRFRFTLMYIQYATKRMASWTGLYLHTSRKLPFFFSGKPKKSLQYTVFSLPFCEKIESPGPPPLLYVFLTELIMNESLHLYFFSGEKNSLEMFIQLYNYSFLHSALLKIY